jgi:hypothetical protein
MLIFWAVSGENTSGIPGLLPERMVWWARSLALGVIVASSAFAYRATQTSTWRGLAYLAGVVVFVHVFAFIVAVSGPDADAFAYAFPGAFALAIAFAGAGAGAGGYGVGAVSGVLVSVVAIAFVGTNFGAGVFAFVAAFVGVFAFSFNHLHEFQKRCDKQGLFYGCYIISIFIILTALVPYSLNLQIYIGVWRVVTLLLIIFVLLPIINSIFDWLSVAATRWLLRPTKDGEFGGWHIAGKAFMDAVIGVALLTALAVVCTAALQTMNLLSQANGGRVFYDLAGLLGRLRNEPDNPAVWWVYAMLFSTMLPTLAHVVFAGSTVVTWSMPNRWREKMQDLVNPDKYKYIDKIQVQKEEFLSKDFPLRLYVAGLLALLDATALILVMALCLFVYVVVWVLTGFSGWLPGLAHGLLWLCENVAGWLGAPL